MLVALQITPANAAVLSATATQVCTDREIRTKTCAYLDTSVSRGEINVTVVSNLVGQECFDSGISGPGTSDRWDVAGWCVYNGSGHDHLVYATQYCANAGYNILVYDRDSSANTVSWSCACEYDKSFVEWRTYSTSVLRRYAPTAGTNCAITAAATNEYKCAPGYYGPNNSTTGCKACPANATCPGGTNFSCNSGYYKNDAGTGCNKCPDSKVGNLGWDANGNGIPAVEGVDSITLCAIPEGTVVYDTTGKFVITDNADGCEYSK